MRRRGLGRQAAGRREGVETVGCELIWRDVVPDVAGFCTLGEQVADEIVEVLLRPDDVLVSMEECPELGGVTFALDERIGLEHGSKSSGRVASLFSECR
jgi:hypothetical protein